MLEGVGNGGASFIESLVAVGAVPNPILIAYAVLREWCDQKPEESYGGKLFNVLNLESVSPATAKEFESRLIPSSASPAATAESEQPVTHVTGEDAS